MSNLAFFTHSSFSGSFVVGSERRYFATKITVMGINISNHNLSGHTCRINMMG